MCCNFRIHVIVISIIYIILTGSAYWILEIGINKWDLKDSWNNLVCLYLIASGIMCLIGAIYNHKCLLIPIMIGLCLTILVCVILLIIAIYWRGSGSSFYGYHYKCTIYNKYTMTNTCTFFLAFISIFLGPSIYILVIVAKLYKEPTSLIVARQGDWVELPERVVVRPHISPTVTPGSTVNVAHDTQIKMF